MNAKGLVVAALVVGGIVFVSSRGCLSSPAPDERYAQHVTKLCDIARRNVETPEPGVRELGRYLGNHAGDMLKDLADTIALIERIDDDKKHDARARVTRDRWDKVSCTEDWMDFLDAVEQDPDAAELVDQRIERMSRTLEIIFPSGRPAMLDAAGLERLWKR